MPTYNVKATIHLTAQAQVEADSEEDACRIAEELEFDDWDVVDSSTEADHVEEDKVKSDHSLPNRHGYCLSGR